MRGIAIWVRSSGVEVRTAATAAADPTHELRYLSGWVVGSCFRLLISVDIGAFSSAGHGDGKQGPQTKIFWFVLLSRHRALCWATEVAGQIGLEWR